MRPIRQILRLVALLLLVVGQSMSASATEATRQLESSIDSPSLGEPLIFTVCLPTGYHDTDRHYPVLYILEDDLYRRAMTGMIDTWSRLGLAPEMIVVGVATRDRWRDFTPTRAGVPGGETIPSSGGVDRFRRALSEDLLPHVEAHWRTRPFRMLCGHSIAGLGALDLFFADADLFDACIATSASLWWDQEVETDRVARILAAGGADPRPLFLAIGNEDQTMSDPLRRFRDRLQAAAPAGPRWTFRRYPEADHPQVPLKAFGDGLDFIFEDWTLPASTAEAGIDAVDAHYAALSDRFGYRIEAPEYVLNRLGYRAMGAGDLETALDIFSRNAAAYPNSANVHDSLGEACLAAGDTALSRSEYDLSRRLAAEAGASTSEAEACLQVVEGMHAFFKAWYRGELERSDANFARLADALAPDFTLITSDGFSLDRENLLGGMRGEWGRRPDMEMWTENFQFRLSEGGLRLFTYEEHGESGGRAKTTLITALMRRSAAADGALQWVHLHEARMEAQR